MEIEPHARAIAPSDAASESAAGRAAAERLSDVWPDVSWVPRSPTEAWADGAIGRFAELIREQRAIFRASQRGARRSAGSLSPRPFQGILEALQNADDLGASELRVAVRRRGARRELLIAHDGDRVQLHHVGAMVLPWLTTKEDDPEASGRFGIGQETLQPLGGPLEVHCAPFQFVLEDEVPIVSSPVDPITGVCSPERHETLFVVPLRKTVDTDKLADFVRELGSSSLLFLRSVRRLSLIDLDLGRPIVEHRLDVISHANVKLQLGRRQLVAERLELRDTLGRAYVRYSVRRPLSEDEPRRHEKKTATGTTLGVALPLGFIGLGRLYDRLPMPVEPGFIFSVNAQFDPDVARTALLANEWNEHRIADLADLIAAVALDAFERDPASAWAAIPLRSDVTLEAGSWLAEQFGEAVAAAQRLARERLRLNRRGQRRTLKRVVFEEKALEGLLTQDDQENLRPGLVAIARNERDSAGRWREVLEELGDSHRVETAEALTIFDQDDAELGPREPRWFVSMLAAAIDADQFDTLLWKRSVLLADGTRVEPPGPEDPRSLVWHLNASSLAAALGIALPIHPVYLAGDDTARRVTSHLKDTGLLLEEVDSADAALLVLARDYDRNTIGRVRIDDSQLLSLRNAFERLGEDEQRMLGPQVGRNIELRAYSYDENGSRVEEWISPVEAYLPSAIDRESASFARSAAQTVGIHWLHVGYARTLKRSGGRRELGAQRFLARLGAAMTPRLIRPIDERAFYKRDSRPVSGGGELERPELQALEIQSLSHSWQRYLLDDRWSPDLDAVIGNIRADKNRQRRRQRGLILLAVLARSWGNYAPYEHARAVYGYDGYWLDPHDIIATWLARAASSPWLPSQTGAMRAPMDLCLPTEANRIAYKDDRAMFLGKVGEQVLRSLAVQALRLRRGPSASSLVERLEQLRGMPPSTDLDAEVRTAYRLLALQCPSDVRRPVDDMSVRRLREAFAGRRGKKGLLYIDQIWYPPREVFAGEHIFGRHRPFVPSSPELIPLWRALEIPRPAPGDCVAVLRELSDAPLAAEDRAVVLQTIRELATAVDSIPPQLRVRLRRLPLWTGTAWRTERPIYAFEDTAIAEQAASQVPVWESGFSSFATLEAVIEALGVITLSLQDFRPTTVNGHGYAAGDHLRPQFARAVQHLRDELARGDQALHDSLLSMTSWRNLCTAPVVIDENLELSAPPKGAGRIVVAADAVMLREPLALVVRGESLMGTAEGAGRAIASLFAGDRQKVAWAWVSMWQRAASGQAPEQILLSTDQKGDGRDESTERLIRLQGQTRARGAHRRKDTRSGTPTSTGTTTVTVQPLKDLNEYEPDHGRIVNEGASRGGVIFPARDRRAAAQDRGRAEPGHGGQLGVHGTRRRTVPAPVSDREQLAYDAVRKALQLDPPQIADLRSRYGIGADAMDELRQFYEVKMESSSEFPKEVTLQGSQVDAAQNDGDFFLAVVAGLSVDSSELRVRFIFNPLDQLTVRIKGEATLSGVPRTPDIGPLVVLADSG